MKILRKSRAYAKGCHPYGRFSDTCIREMAIARPNDREHFARITGVREMRFMKYGRKPLHSVGFRACFG
ncbi:MAG TPA: HRDC domain-containing protein [Methanoregula sp.]|nr:HRDC domain-containing protein [Methanoregula sp.]